MHNIWSNSKFFWVVPVADQKHFNFVFGTEEVLTEFFKKVDDLLKFTRNLSPWDFDLVFFMINFG